MVRQEKETSRNVNTPNTKKQELGSIGRKIATGVIVLGIAFEGGGNNLHRT